MMIQKFASEHGTVKEDEDLFVIHLWDHGGQEAYLPAHVALLGDYSEFSSGIYIIAFNQSKLLTAPAPLSVFRCKDGADTVQPLCLMEKNVDYLSYWMTAIQIAHPYADGKSRCMGEKEDITSPPTFLVGTYDKAEGSAKCREKNEEALDELISEKDYWGHLVQSDQIYWPVENSDSGKPGRFPGAEIRKKVEKLALDYWEDKRHPIRWLKFEQCLLKAPAWNKVKVGSEEYPQQIVKKELAIAIAVYACNMPMSEVEVALKYLSSLGVILYYPQVDELKGEVFVDPQWLIDVVCSFITAKKPEKGVPRYHWKRAKEYGKVNVRYLAKHFLEESHVNAENHSTILHILEYLDILCNPEPSLPLDKVDYVFVPALLSASQGLPSFISASYPPKRCPPPLIFAPVGVHAFPEPLFFRLVVRCLREKTYNKFPKLAELKRNICTFTTKSNVKFEICLYRKCYMVLSILSCDFERKPEQLKTFPDLRDFVCFGLNEARKNGMKGFKYEVCVQPGIREKSKNGDDCKIVDKRLILLGQFFDDDSSEYEQCRESDRCKNLECDEKDEKDKDKALEEGALLWLPQQSQGLPASPRLDAEDSSWQSIKVTEHQLINLHTKIQHMWPVIGRQLGPTRLDDYQIEQIAMATIPNTEKCIKMFRTWSHKQSGGHGTVFNLLKILFDDQIDLGDPARQVFEDSVIVNFLQWRK
eukprot:m.265346 g.265346  ORF g.265346 m.265346 type:complete len:701 (+) comp40486_c0_seq5:448-2550(+)